MSNDAEYRQISLRLHDLVYIRDFNPHITVVTIKIIHITWWLCMLIKASAIGAAGSWPPIHIRQFS